MANRSPKKVVLMIMDGWGIAPADKYNAIANADTPNIDRLIREYPNTSLKTDGLSVGLPEGQFGTSEVNHLTIGSGRVILQDLPRINAAIQSGEFKHNEALLKVVAHAEKNDSNINLIGILSDGGVHSHIDHLIAILEMLSERNFARQVNLHLFTDGRDVAPKSAEKYFTQLEKAIAKLKNLNIIIASMQGRYLLDRDRDWEKTEQSLKLIANGEGHDISSWQAALNLAYTTIKSDEYLGQFSLNKQGNLSDNDAVFIFHYRTDRIFQIIQSLFNSEIKNLKIGSFVLPSEDFKELEVAFPRLHITDTLAETIATAGRSQLHIAETEKFPHVTYFLNGEREKELPQEDWKSFESNRFIKPRYNFEPSMRNFEIAKEIIAAVEAGEKEFIIANFSSADMVGHTGNYNAAVVSAESVDFCVGMIYEAMKGKLDDYALIITADHGNSEIMWDYENDQPHTQHTLSKVPFILISNLKAKLDRRESLEDIAPTILDLMGIEKPAAMTGNSLVIEE